MFNKIHIEKWERREHFPYYRNLIKTNYSINAEINITELRKIQKEKGIKFFSPQCYTVL